MSIKKLAIIAAGMTCLSATAQASPDGADGWFDVATGSATGTVFAYKVHSGQVFQNPHGGAWLAAAIFRYIETDGQTSFYYKLVTRDNCAAGAGNVWSKPVGTADYAVSGTFVFGGGNVNSTIAETLCGMFVKQTAKQPHGPETSL
jgi:hypothetical protein